MRIVYTMYKWRTILLVVIGSLLTLEPLTRLQAQTVSNVGTTAAAFLEIGVGARAQAMGGAYVALANDATAMYWNPAGIGRLENIEVMFTYFNWLGDTRFTFAGIVFPLGGIGSIGASVSTFGMPDQPVRVIGQEEGTGEYYAAGDLALGLSFAYNLTDRFSLGFNAKYIDQRIWHTSAHGFALDLAALYQTQWEGLKLGFSLSNLGTNMQLSGRDLLNAVDPDKNNSGVENISVNYSTDEYPLPLIFRFGIAQQVKLFSEDHLLTLSADVMHPNNNVETVNVGFEYTFHQYLALRAGYESLFNSERMNGLTLGLGVSASVGSIGTSIDYAYADWGVFKAVHRLSIRMTL